MVDSCILIGIGIGAERLCHQTTDKQVFDLPAMAERDTLISLVVWKCLQQSGVSMFQGFDAPKGTDEVLSAITRDFPPLFVGKIFNIIQKINSFLYCLKNRERSFNMFDKIFFSKKSARRQRRRTIRIQSDPLFYDNPSLYDENYSLLLLEYLLVHLAFYYIFLYSLPYFLVYCAENLFRLS